ncbi:MAG: GCG_CRPN prefix-to-repeats domain-containing protein [Rhizomicrobium sp.]|jgi:hypothetical protein
MITKLLSVSAMVVAFATANALAKEGCGAGFHMNNHGVCVASGAHGAAVGGAVVAAPGVGVAVGVPGVAVGVTAPIGGAVVACPAHYHMNGKGVCRPN